MTDSQKISMYLRRIGLEKVKFANFATLQALQRAHLEAIPYENLDIIRGVPISLEFDNMYEKIIVRRRGGYCFELNGLFAWLLRVLGFQVREYLARFLRGGTEIPPRGHRVLVIAIKNEGEFLCDAGVGGIIPRKPVLLKPGTVNKQNGEMFKIERDEISGYILHEWRKESWCKIYSFTREEQFDIDFTVPSFYCEKHPSSPFRTKDMVHIFTKDGRKSIDGRELRIFSPGGVEVTSLGADAVFRQVLKSHFGIEL